MGEELVLVTGYPGLQARRLVERILAAEPDTHLALVVLDRLRESAARHLARLEDRERARVEVLEGDVAAIDMGLSGREVRALARRITRIHHVAHLSWVGVDRQAAEQVNVGGAVEAVEIARVCERLRCLVHHSTAHVSGDRAGVVYEQDLDEGQGFHNVVQETRMKAELIMRRAMADLPIAVVRPTMLVGDSGTGETDRFDGPYLLVMFLLGFPGDLALPLPTKGDNPLDIVPVDFVVKAAHHIGRDPRALGRTFHLASSENLTARQVFEAIARAGGKRTARQVIPSQVTAALMATPGVARFLQEPRALMKQLATKAKYDTRHAQRVLAETGIACPPFDSYAGTLVERVQERFREAT